MKLAGIADPDHWAIPDSKADRLRVLVSMGLLEREVADLYGVDQATVSNNLARLGFPAGC